MLRLSSRIVLPALLALPAFVACPTPPVEGEGEGEEGEGEEGEGEGENPGDGDCPVVEGGNSVCDVQDGNSPNAVPTGAIVTLPGVVATTQVVGSSFENNVATRFSVYVANAPNAKRGGIVVQWDADQTDIPTDIAIGDVLTVTGTVSEQGPAGDDTETRIDVQSITKDGVGTPLEPLAITAADLAGASGEDYEGVLIQLTGGEVTEVGQFAFLLDNGASIANAIFRYDALVGETFTSITGVVRFDVFDGQGFDVQPRNADDVVSLERPTPPSSSVTDLNDGTVTRCAFDQARDCPALVVDAVVVSPMVFVNDDQFPSFQFWVADANNKDADGRLGPKSGVMVTFLKNTPPTSAEYSFEQETEVPFPFLPGAAPEIGDVIEITGRNTEDFAQGEFEATAIKKVTTVTADPTKAVLPALFSPDAGHDPSELKGGRPEANGDFPGIENIPAAANIEDWEGVLVELQNVETTNPCYAQVFANGGNPFARDFGNFLVTGDVEIGDVFRLDQSFGGFFDSNRITNNADKTCENRDEKCEDSRVDGQVFNSLVGIVNFSFNVHRVNPRSADDIDANPGFVAPNTPADKCPAP